jgi:predicted AAA+ superfamily ATPase
LDFFLQKKIQQSKLSFSESFGEQLSVIYKNNSNYLGIRIKWDFLGLNEIDF